MKHAKYYLTVILVTWTLVIAASMTLNIYQNRQSTIELARTQARIAYERDLVYRAWNADHGGVYVTVNDTTPPNPHLDTPERDITTPSGRLLTLVNPAYMTRKVYELARKKYGIRGHITSLRPIRPENAADLWETEALKLLKRGEKEVSSIEDMEGERYLRLMKPLITEKECVQCHAAQGFVPGDIRGGISVAVPMTPLLAISQENIHSLLLGHSAVCLLGLFGIVLGSRHLRSRARERNQAVAELKSTKEHLDNIITSSLDSIIITDTQGYITRTSSSLLSLLGYTREEIMGKHTADFSPSEEGVYTSSTGKEVTITKEYFANTQGKSSTLLEKGKLVNWERYFIRKDQKVVPVELNLTLLFNEEGEMTGGVGVVRDITERKEKERELIEQREFLERVIENSKDGIIITDEKGHIFSANSTIEQISDFKKEELVGKHASVLIAKDNIRQKILKSTAELFEKGFAVYELRHDLKDGRKVDIECISSLVRDERGNIIAGISTMRNITERRKMEREISEGRDFLENIIKSSRDGIIIANEKEEITLINAAMEEICGYTSEELCGEHPYIFSSGDEGVASVAMEKIAELYDKGFAINESKVKTKDGQVRDVECSISQIKDSLGHNLGSVCIVRDITERKVIEHKLFKAEKLKSLGELAGGVAHDFNNVLSAILGRAQLLKMNIETPRGIDERRESMIDLKESLEVIERAAKDGAETVRRIQEFARRRVEDKHFTQVDINEVIDTALKFTRIRWKDNAEANGIKIDIKKELSTLPATSGSAAELREVFTNLINNAVDAMPQGGQIKIKTFEEDRHVVIKVEDSGAGIADDRREKIFDPFFTTKGVKSSGLGLSVSYGIISRHLGTIAVDSVEGKGTVFIINLPVSSKVPKQEKVKSLSEEPRKARVLVIEDEEDVGTILSAILARAGHEVDIAANGKQGIEKFDKKEYDLVFTDLGMPGMSGWQVAEKIKSGSGRAPVVLVTGWEITLNEHEAKDNWVDFIIQKPFEVDQVLRTVQQGMALRDRFKAA